MEETESPHEKAESPHSLQPQSDHDLPSPHPALQEGAPNRKRKNLQGGLKPTNPPPPPPPPHTLEESPAPTVDKGEEEAPTFKILPRAGRAQSSPSVGFAIRGSETEGEEDLETGGFMTEWGEDLRKGSRAGLAPNGLGISDLMS